MALQQGILLLELPLLAEQGLKPLLKLALKDGRQFLQKLPQAAGFSVCRRQLPLKAPQGWRRGRRG
jgi:hypothetical protein